jgi:hypothetical protein
MPPLQLDSANETSWVIFVILQKVRLHPKLVERVEIQLKLALTESHFDLVDYNIAYLTEPSIHIWTMWQIGYTNTFLHWFETLCIDLTL